MERCSRVRIIKLVIIVIQTVSEKGRRAIKAASKSLAEKINGSTRVI